MKVNWGHWMVSVGDEESEAEKLRMGRDFVKQLTN